MSRIRRRASFFPQQRRLFSNSSLYDVLPLAPLEVNFLIEDLFDQLDFYDRAVSRIQPQRFFQPRRQQQFGPRQLSRQRRTPSQIRSKKPSNVRQRQQPFLQKKQQQFLQPKQPFMQKQKKKPQFGGLLQQQKQQPLQQQKPFVGGAGVMKKSPMAKQQQKYRICIDCRNCDCDPSQIKKSIKSGVNGLSHLTVSAPCIKCPSKLFQRSYTLPSKVQRQKMVSSITPQGHCLIEFPLMEEPQNLQINELLMPLQKIKTPEGKRAFFVQVPILPIMDPAKVKVCVKEGKLVVKFEHRKTIGDICSRVFYCCEVPLPNNIDFSNILCKQNKHTLNVTLPVKSQTVKGGGGGGGMIYREIPVHRKLRHRKTVGGTAAAGVSKQQPSAMPSTTMQQQKPSISGLQRQQPQIQQQQKSKKKTSTISTSLQQPTQSIGTNVKPSATNVTTTTPDIKKKKIKKQKKNKNLLGSDQGDLNKPSGGQVSKGSQLLDQVFGFSGKATTQQQQPSSSAGGGQDIERTPTSLDKGVQDIHSQVSDKYQSTGTSSSSTMGGAGQVQGSSSGASVGDVNKPDLSSSSQAVPGAGIQ